MTRFISAALVSFLLAFSIALGAQQAEPGKPSFPVTAAGAVALLKHVNERLLDLDNAASRAGWVQSTYITPDTEVMAAQANEALVSASTAFATEAFRFDTVQVPAGQRRQLYLLKNSLTMSAPPDQKEAEELTRLVASMEGAYGASKYCPSEKTARSTTSRPTRRTRAIFSRGCCSSSSTGRSRRRRAARRRCTGARSTATRRPASGCRR